MFCLDNLIRSHKTRCQFSFGVKTMNSSKRRDTKIHIISFFKTQISAAIVGITLMTTLTNKQSFLTKFHLFFHFPQDTRPEHVSLSPLLPQKRSAALPTI